MNSIVPWARAGVSAYSPTFAPIHLSRPEVNPPSPTAPSGLKEWWREMQAEQRRETQGPVQSAIVGLRHNLEGAGMGALLALVDTDLGGLDLGGRVPMDWVGAAFFYALSIKNAGDQSGLSSDFGALGQSCTTVAMYRMVHRWREAAKNMPRNIPTSGDPVLKAGASAEF